MSPLDEGASARERELAERLDALAAEKATVDLVLRLIERLNPLASIEDLVRDFLAYFVETIGGTDARLYYWDEGQLRRVGIHEPDVAFAAIDHPLAREAAERRESIERVSTEVGGHLLEGGAASACSWAIPLLVRGELLGVVAFDDLHVTWRALGRHLRAAFDHAALILCNELRRRSRDRATAALRENQERLRILADGLPGGLVYQLRVDADGRAARFTHLSAGVAALHGLDVAAVLAEPRRLVAQLEDPTWPRLLELQAAAVSELSPIALEIRFRAASGQVRWALLCSVPRRPPDGGVVWDGVEIDVTDRRLAEEERHRLQLLLLQAQKMDAVGQLAGGVAHDFNNLLGVVLLNMALLLELELPEEAREEILQVNEAVNRGVALARQLLVFSRRELPRPRPTELHALLGNLLRMLRRMIGETISLELVAGLDEVWLEADPGMLEQAVMNLVVNARDAMPDGGRVTLRTEPLELGEGAARRNPAARAGRFVALEVVDTGVGMDAATAEHIFEPFFTTKAPGRGTGLGLAMVHGIVTQHRGWIELETSPGRGALFRVVLPRAASAQGDDAAERPPGASRVGHERVLVVEDDPALRRVVATALERLGYAVVSAADGAEALLHFGSSVDQLDLVLSDVVMPGGVSGPQLVTLLRQRRPQLKAVLMSGHAAELAAGALAADARIRFLPKPISAGALARTVREALDDA